MSEQELLQKINCVADKIEKANRRKNIWFQIMITTFSIFTITVIWKASALFTSMNDSIRHLEEQAIEPAAWKNNEVKTDVAWRHALNIPSDVRTRGGQ